MKGGGGDTQEGSSSFAANLALQSLRSLTPSLPPLVTLPWVWKKELNANTRVTTPIKGLFATSTPRVSEGYENLKCPALPEIWQTNAEGASVASGIRNREAGRLFCKSFCEKRKKEITSRNFDISILNERTPRARQKRVCGAQGLEHHRSRDAHVSERAACPPSTSSAANVQIRPTLLWAE